MKLGVVPKDLIDVPPTAPAGVTKRRLAAVTTPMGDAAIRQDLAVQSAFCSAAERICCVDILEQSASGRSSDLLGSNE
jgi:hypothetical protein